MHRDEQVVPQPWRVYRQATPQETPVWAGEQPSAGQRSSSLQSCQTATSLQSFYKGNPLLQRKGIHAEGRARLPRIHKVSFQLSSSIRLTKGLCARPAERAVETPPQCHQQDEEAAAAASEVSLCSPEPLGTWYMDMVNEARRCSKRI